MTIYRDASQMANSSSRRRFRHGVGWKLDPIASSNPWSGMSVSPHNGIAMPRVRNDPQFGGDLERKPPSLLALSPFGASSFFNLSGWCLHAVPSSFNEVDTMASAESAYSPHALVCHFNSLGIKDSDDVESFDFLLMVTSLFDTYGRFLLRFS